MGHSFQIPPLRPSRSYKMESMVKLGSVKDYKVQKPGDAGSVLRLTRSLPQSASRVIDLGLQCSPACNHGKARSIVKFTNASTQADVKTSN